MIMSNRTVYAGLICDNCQSGAIGQLLDPQTGNRCPSGGAGQAGQDCGASGATFARGRMADKGKWEEMKSYRQSQPQKPRDGEQTKFPQNFFHFYFPSVNR